MGLRPLWMAAIRLKGRLVSLTAAVALLAGLAAAPSPAAAAVALPSFYKVPTHIPSTPGTLIKSQKVSVSGVAATVYRVMYTSLTLQTKPVAVTGLVFVPKSTPPAGGFPVVSWGHGTNGMATQCAPSLTPSAGTVPEINALLAQGWEVTASDYQGEGTPGPLPYLVGDVAARNTVDIVRAAQHLAAAHAGSDYVVWGHSEGGLTAMYSLHIAATYAPTLHLEGVVAGAPPSQFALIYTFLKTSPYRFYLFMAAVGFEKAYGAKAAPLAEVLTAKAMKLEPDLTKGCFTYLEKTIDHYSLVQLVKKNPFDVPAWKTLLEDNDPEYFTTAAPAPLLIYQGGADTQIPVVSTQILAQHLCSVGQDTERWIYPGMTHTAVITVAIGDIVHWVADRFAGDANPDPYAPIGMPGVTVTTCG